MSTKKPSKKNKALPGSDLINHLKNAKNQTKALLDKSKKNAATAKLKEQGHAKKYKVAQDNLKKHDANHKNKPSKSSSQYVASAKSKLKQAQDLHTKAQDFHAKARDQYSTHKDHYDKLNHFHTAHSNAEKSWKERPANSQGKNMNRTTRRAK